MDRLHLKYVMLNKNNVWYRLYYNYATLHAPPPSPHNKSYDNIDIDWWPSRLVNLYVYINRDYFN